MRNSSEVDVLIVGGGPTGLTLANLLGSLGVSTLIVERSATTSDMPRAIVLDDEGARTLQACGLADAVLDGTLTGEGSHYETRDGAIIAEVGRGIPEYGFPKRNFISQPVLERTLFNSLSRWSSVERAFGTMLAEFKHRPDGVDAVLVDGKGERNTRAKWLVACDGGRSPIRESLGITFDGSTYSQDWVVLDMSRDPHTETYSRFICDAGRPSVVVPAPNGGRRYEFMLLPGESRSEAISPEVLAKLLAPHRPYVAEDVIRAVVYTFHARVAETWQKGRVLLAGDAAHLTPPFAGQGMNAGLRDAGNLAWKLAAHVGGLAGAGLLTSYELERRAPCIAMIELAVLMGKVIMPRTAEEAGLQDAIMMLTADAPALKRYLFEMRFKPRPYYELGALVRTEDDVPASLVGHMLPQFEVESGEGSRRLDDVLGQGFALIGQDCSVAAIRDATHPVWRELDPCLIQLVPKDSAEKADGVQYVRPAMAGAAPLRAHRDQLMLVRPDRYVAAAFEPEEADRFGGYIADQFRSAEAPVEAGSFAPKVTAVAQGAGSGRPS